MTDSAPEAVIEAMALRGKRVIWSNEHRAWWRPNRCGYCINLLGAGLYSLEEAEEICRKAAPRDEEHRDAEAEWLKLLSSASTGTVGDAVLSSAASRAGFVLVPVEGGKQIAERVTQRICDFDDRTSPDDWPEALLVTAEELTAIIEDEFAEMLAARPGAAPTKQEE